MSCNKSEYKPENKNNVSKQATSFNLLNIKGQTKSLKDYKGKYLLINFWATWCPPCVAELPALNNVALRYQNKNLEVLTINTDPESQRKKVEELYNKKNFKFEVLYDPELKIAEEYGVRGFPETFFVDPNGNLVEFYDPKEEKKVLKVISDREWDSKELERSFEDLFKIK